MLSILADQSKLPRSSFPRLAFNRMNKLKKGLQVRSSTTESGSGSINFDAKSHVFSISYV